MIIQRHSHRAAWVKLHTHASMWTHHAAHQREKTHFIMIWKAARFKLPTWTWLSTAAYAASFLASSAMMGQQPAILRPHTHTCCWDDPGQSDRNLGGMETNPDVSLEQIPTHLFSLMTRPTHPAAQIQTIQPRRLKEGGVVSLSGGSGD